jgi:hypothetical protein
MSTLRAWGGAHWCAQLEDHGVSFGGETPFQAMASDA